VAKWGVTANAATLAAWATGIGAAAAFGWGTVPGWLIGAALLQVWYLLDHVDGQLARFHGTASLDGVQLDYLMHHTVNLLVPAGVGLGLFSRSAQPLWLFGGVLWGVSLLLIGLQHDARYKAFYQRLKRLRGELRVIGGGGGRPQPQPPMPRTPRRFVAWSIRKLCETHVIMNVLSLTALGQLVLGDHELVVGRFYLLLATAASSLLAVLTIARAQKAGQAEQEFAMWYQLPKGHQMEFADGWWEVRPRDEATDPCALHSPPQPSHRESIQS
jgi:phosphatidylglycerophosphate synthase